MDRASATEVVDLGSIPGRVKPKIIKIGIHSFPAWRSAIKGAVRGGQMDRWQLDSKTERSLRCLLAKATWWIKCNYIILNYTPELEYLENKKANYIRLLID